MFQSNINTVSIQFNSIQFNSIYSMFHAIHTDIELVNKIIYKQSSIIHYIQLK